MSTVLNVVALTAFASALFVRSVDPIIPPIAADFAVAPATAALLSTAFAFPYAFMQPVLGALADMVSKIRLMSICLVVLVAAALVGAFATNFAVLMGSRIIAGIASGGIFPIALALAGDLVPVQQRQVAIGRLLAAALTGNLLGASAAGVIADYAGWRGVFVFTAAAGASVLVAAQIALRGVTRRPSRVDWSTIGPNYRAIFGNPLAKYCFGAVLIEGAVLFGLMPYIATLLHEAGETRAAIAGLVIAGFGIGGVIYTFSVSLLLRQVGEPRLMWSGGMLMALCLILVGLRPPWQVQFLALLVLGFSFYMLHGPIQVFVTELAPQARGSAAALHSAFFFFGQALGPVGYGIGFAALGAPTSLSIGAVLLALTGIVCARSLRHRPAALPA